MAVLFRLEIVVQEEDAELLEGILALEVGHGWEEMSLPTGETMCVVHSGHAGFCTELKATVLGYLPDAEVQALEVEEKNWAETWKEFFTPVEGGTHFIVLAPWMEKERQETNRMPIIIEPKMAFGTGHHATTSLCLDALSSCFTDGRIKKGMRFFDLGTGSGILGLGAVKLGLTGAGCDIDPASVDNAIENREINKISAADFSLSLGGVECIQEKYDLIFANILAAPLKHLAPAIVAGLASEGCLILSGMLDVQADSVEEVYLALGLPKAVRLARGEWVALLFR